MERLTVKTGVYQNGKLEIIVGMKCGVEFKDIFDRLAAYEDTGLEPEEIGLLAKQRNLYVDACGELPLKRIRELAQADREDGTE